MAKFMKDWERFVLESRGVGNFRAARSLVMRFLLRGAGNRERTHESGARIDFKNLQFCIPSTIRRYHPLHFW